VIAHAPHVRDHGGRFHFQPVVAISLAHGALGYRRTTRRQGGSATIGPSRADRANLQRLFLETDLVARSECALRTGTS